MGKEDDSKTKRRKIKRRPQANLTQEQWDKIRIEWEAGTDLALVVQEYGKDASGNTITTQAIYVRAKREAWPARPKQSPVNERVTKIVREADSGSNSLLFAATSLNRVLSLMQRHRGIAKQLMQHLEASLARISEFRDERASSGRKTTIKEESIIIGIVARATETLARLIPIERKAIGLTDDDGASEFDMLTDDELEALERAVRQWMDVVRGKALPAGRDGEA